MLVEPRELYRVKAGIFDLCSSFDALFVSLDIVYISREIGPATRYISWRHLEQELEDL